MKIRVYQTADEAAVIDLWQRSGLVRAQNNPQADIARKQDIAPELFLVGELEGEIIATIMVGYEGHRGWINYLAIAPALQKRGYGRQMMEHGEALLRGLGCPKINLQVRSDNGEVIEFYRQLGFVDDEVASLGKRLQNDEPFST